MTEKLVYVVELTEDEAIAFSLLVHAGVSGQQGFAAEMIQAVANALEKADHTLNTKQFAKWRELGDPNYTLESTR